MRVNCCLDFTNQHVPPRAVQLVNGPTKPDRLCRRGGAPFSETTRSGRGHEFLTARGSFSWDSSPRPLQKKQRARSVCRRRARPALVMRNLWSGGLHNFIYSFFQKGETLCRSNSLLEKSSWPRIGRVHHHRCRCRPDCAGRSFHFRAQGRRSIRGWSRDAARCAWRRQPADRTGEFAGSRQCWRDRRHWRCQLGQL